LDQTSLHFPKAVVITLITRLLMLAGALGTSITVGRWLGAAGLGSLAVINVTIALGVQIGSFGFPSANTYFISRNRNDLGKVWANSFLFATVVGVVIAVLIVVSARLRPTAFGQVTPSLITIAAVSLPFQLMMLIGMNVFLAVGQISRFNITDALYQLALLVNALVALAVLRAGLPTLVSFNATLAVVTGVIIVFTVRRIAKKIDAESSWFDLAIFRQMLRYGLKFHIAVVAAIVIVRADLLLVNHFRGATEAGVYAVAGQMANLLMLFPAVIATLLFPRTSADPDPQARLTMRVTRHTAFILLLVCLVAVPFSFALPLIYGSAFENSTVQLLILLPGVYLFGIESVLVQHFTGSGLPLTVPLFWIAVVICNLVFNIIFIPTYGATAAAIVSSFTYALIFLLVAIYFRVKTGNHLLSTLVMQPDEIRALIRPARLSFFSE
jgi:O-antigen/teichoic acid export membrane protein